MRDTGDLFVLLGDPLVRVCHEYAYVSPLDRHFGAQYAVAFDAVCDLALPSDTGGVDKHEFSVFVFDLGIDRVARRARNVRNDKPVLADNAVDKRAFAGVRLADHSYLYHVGIVLGIGLLGQIFKHPVK